MDFTALETDLVEALRGRNAARARARGRARAAAAIAAGALALAGGAVAAQRLLGSPAPASVQADLAGVDVGLPADIRLLPDATHARAVATDGDSVLFAADLPGGGYCTEIVTDDSRPRGVTCADASDVASRSIGVSVPSDDTIAPDAPVTLGGRVDAPRGSRLVVTYGDGANTDEIPLSPERFFVFDVPSAHRALARAGTIRLTAFDDSRRQVGEATIPADWSRPAVPDSTQPLFVSTKSDSADFTKVYGIEGHVGVAGATRLELRYADGSVTQVPLDNDGTFNAAIADDRVDAFMRPQVLVALDANGVVLATAHIAAVAYWRGVERHRGSSPHAP